MKDAYHVVCKPCAENLKICAKCLQEKEIIKDGPSEEDKLVEKLKASVINMSERHRRSFLRKIERYRGNLELLQQLEMSELSSDDEYESD